MAVTQSDKFRIENFLPVIDQFATALEHRLCANGLDVLSSQEILTNNWQ